MGPELGRIKNDSQGSGLGNLVSGGTILCDRKETRSSFGGVEDGMRSSVFNTLFWVERLKLNNDLKVFDIQLKPRE